MRVACLAAGAGGMYCGSCLRDNRLVRVLRAMGRDVLLVPLYTPLRTDEPPARSERIRYGGISVFLEERFAWARKMPRALARLLASPALLRAVGARAARTAPADVADLTLSVLRGPRGNQARELDDLIELLRELKPDVIVLPNLLFAGAAEAMRSELRAPIVCTLSGEDQFIDALPPAQRADALRLIRQASDAIDLHIAVSRYYARRAAEFFGLPPERIDYAPLGIAADQFPQAAPPPDRFRIGYLGRISADKGFPLLIDACRGLWESPRAIEVRCAGTPGDVEAAGALAAADRFDRRDPRHALVFDGELDWDAKLRFLAGLHAFTLPTRYPEAKGLPVLEALACGVPVVQPAHGSFPELIEETGGGLLVRPNDPRELAAALLRLAEDDALRTRLGDAGRAAVRERFTDIRMAEESWKIFEKARAGFVTSTPAG